MNKKIIEDMLLDLTADVSHDLKHCAQMLKALQVRLQSNADRITEILENTNIPLERKIDTLCHDLAFTINPINNLISANGQVQRANQVLRTVKRTLTEEE
jgi:hypothetical protein